MIRENVARTSAYLHVSHLSGLRVSFASNTSNWAKHDRLVNMWDMSAPCQMIGGVPVPDEHLFVTCTDHTLSL